MAVNLVQSAFRIRGDRQAAQGGTPGWYAAQNTVGIPTQQAAFRIRFQIENTGATASTSNAWQLYASRNAGAYAAVTGVTTFVQSADGSGGGSANNSAITSALLTGGVTTFTNGLYCSSGATSAFSLPGTDYTELEFGIVFTASIVGGDTYAFEVYNNNTPLNTYSQIPTLSPTTNLPDLFPTAVIYYESNNQFEAIIHNGGPGSTPVGCTVGCAFLVDGTQQSWGLTQPDPLAPIASGGDGFISSVGSGGPFVISNGNHIITCHVNDGNFFTETTLANNFLAVPITVPNLYVSSQRMITWY
jgi:hypothetical protein